MRINPAWRLTAAPDGSVSVGCGPDALNLGPVHPADREWLRSLSSGTPAPDPVDAEQARRWASLGVALASVIAPVATEGLPGLAAQRLSSDSSDWAAAYGQAAGPRVRSRLDRRVWLGGADRCGMAVAFTLAAAGVGSLSVRDDARVEAGDLGTSPLRLTELGLPRPVALQRHLQRLYPHAHLLAPVTLDQALRGCDALILVARDGLDPADAALLATSTVPVLPVVFHESGFRVGPLLLPGAPGCPECAMLAWPLLPRGELLSGLPPSPETTSAALAAGLCAQVIVMVLDGVNVPSCAGGSYVGTLGAASLHFEELPSSCSHAQAA